MPGTSTTAVAALAPRLIAAVHPDPAAMLKASAATLATRADGMWEDDADDAMRLAAAALETLGELFRKGGDLYRAQLATGTEEEGEESAKFCHSAGWDMRAAARDLRAALAARGQRTQ